MIVYKDIVSGKKATEHVSFSKHTILTQSDFSQNVKMTFFHGYHHTHVLEPVTPVL